MRRLEVLRGLKAAGQLQEEDRRGLLISPPREEEVGLLERHRQRIKKIRELNTIPERIPMKRGSHVDVDDVERRKEGEASSAVKKEEVGEKPVEETPTANEARSDPGTAVTAGSATNQQAAETTPSAEPDVKEEAAENTPAAESTETPGETGVGRRNIKVYTHGERRGIETSSMEQRAMEEDQAAEAKGAGKTGSQLEALLE